MNSIINTHTPISGNIVLLLWESETKGNHKIVISCFLLEIAWTSLYFPQMTYFPCHISTSTAEHGLCPFVVNKSHIFYQPGYKLCCVAKKFFVPEVLVYVFSLSSKLISCKTPSFIHLSPQSYLKCTVMMIKRTLASVLWFYLSGPE